MGIQGYDPRQFDYYFNAAKWLGFVDGRPSNIIMTEKGPILQI